MTFHLVAPVMNSGMITLINYDYMIKCIDLTSVGFTHQCHANPIQETLTKTQHIPLFPITPFSRNQWLPDSHVCTAQRI